MKAAKTTLRGEATMALLLAGCFAWLLRSSQAAGFASLAHW